MHVTDTTATPNGHQMAVVTWDRSIAKLMKKKFFLLWAGWVASYLQRSLSAQVPPLTAENSGQGLRGSGAQGAALVMYQLTG